MKRLILLIPALLLLGAVAWGQPEAVPHRVKSVQFLANGHVMTLVPATPVAADSTITLPFVVATPTPHPLESTAHSDYATTPNPTPIASGDILTYSTGPGTLNGWGHTNPAAWLAVFAPTPTPANTPVATATPVHTPTPQPTPTAIPAGTYVTKGGNETIEGAKAWNGTYPGAYGGFAFGVNTDGATRYPTLLGRSNGDIAWSSGATDPPDTSITRPTVGTVRVHDHLVTVGSVTAGTSLNGQSLAVATPVPESSGGTGKTYFSAYNNLCAESMATTSTTDFAVRRPLWVYVPASYATADLVTNGGFDATLTGWTATGDWAAYDQGGGNYAAVCDQSPASTGGTLTQSIPTLRAGAYYEVGYNGNVTAGTCAVSLGGTSAGNISAGAQTVVVKAGSSNTNLVFTAAADFAGGVDLVTLKRLDGDLDVNDDATVHDTLTVQGTSALATTTVNGGTFTLGTGTLIDNATSSCLYSNRGLFSTLVSGTAQGFANGPVAGKARIYYDTTAAGFQFIGPGNTMVNLGGIGAGGIFNITAYNNITLTAGGLNIGTTGAGAGALKLTGDVTTSGTGRFYEVTATTYYDYTPASPDSPEEALAAIAGIRDDGRGNIDHATLPPFAQGVVRQTVERELTTATTPTQIGGRVKARRIEIRTDRFTSGTKEVEILTTEDPGRNVGAMLSELALAVRALKERNEALQEQVRALEERVAKLEGR